jgi:hypothetical protein
MKSLLSAACLVVCLSAGAARAGVCEWVAGGAAASGTAVATASTVAKTVGVAAVPHAAGGAILTSVGAGGTGFLAGTLGSLAAGALAVVSAPAVIVGAAAVAVAGAGTAGYCYLKD